MAEKNKYEYESIAEAPSVQLAGATPVPGQTQAIYDSPTSQLDAQPYDLAIKTVAAPKPVYAGTFDQQIQDIYNSISNRPAFQYDLTGDPLYQQMKDRYIQGGKMAMKDTMGQAAALTGGYSSSYGQAVGQQQYDRYLQDLSAQIPGLYEMAYGMYQDEGDRLMDQYGMLRQMGDTEYNRYLDQLNNWNYDQEVAYEKERDALADKRYQDELEYNRAWDEEQRDYNRAWDEEQREYERQRQEIEDKRYQDELNYARQQDALNLQLKMMSAAGGSGGGGGRSSGGGGGGGGGYGYDTHGMSTAQIMAMQAAAGIGVDGIWGPQTEAAYQAMYGGGTSLNSYGEVKNGNTPTRGETARAAEAALKNGEINYTQYRNTISQLH